MESAASDASAKACIAHKRGKAMSSNDAKYFSQHIRAQGTPQCDALTGSRFVRWGIELQRLEQLPWPRNLFGECATIAELLAEDSRPSGQRGDDVCSSQGTKAQCHANPI
jgi:hypothetical protein